MITDRTTGFDFTNTPLMAWEIREYVDKRLKETGSNNISLLLPSMTPVMIRALEKHYKISIEPFGHIRFELLK